MVKLSALPALPEHTIRQPEKVISSPASLAQQGLTLHCPAKLLAPSALMELTIPNLANPPALSVVLERGSPQIMPTRIAPTIARQERTIRCLECLRCQVALPALLELTA
jgi:hypothetical protein